MPASQVKKVKSIGSECRSQVILGVGCRVIENLGVSLSPALQPSVHLEGSCFAYKGAKIKALLGRGAGGMGRMGALGWSPLESPGI